MEKNTFMVRVRLNSGTKYTNRKEGSWIELNDENEEKTRVQNGIGSLFIDSIEIFQGSWIEGNPVHGCQTSIHGKYSGE